MAHGRVLTGSEIRDIRYLWRKACWSGTETGQWVEGQHKLRPSVFFLRPHSAKQELSSAGPDGHQHSGVARARILAWRIPDCSKCGNEEYAKNRESERRVGTLCLLAQPKGGQQKNVNKKITRTARKLNCMKVPQPRS